MDGDKSLVTAAKPSQALSIITEPKSRPELLFDSDFCDSLGSIVAYISAITSYAKNRKFFRVEHIATQFNKTVNEHIDTLRTNSASEVDDTYEVFSIDSWFLTNLKWSETREGAQEKVATDWMDLLLDMETKCPGFAKMLANCIDLQDRLSRNDSKRLGEVTFFGSGGTPDERARAHRSPHDRENFTYGSYASFFSGGGILGNAPK
jgi:hypothetical protein